MKKFMIYVIVLFLSSTVYGADDKSSSYDANPLLTKEVQTFLRIELIKAVNERDLNQVKALIELGVDLKAKDENNWTVLMVASLLGDLEIVRELISNGAYVNTQNIHGFTALMYASREGHLKIVKELIRSRAELNAKNVAGDTALVIASEEGHSKIMKVLTSNGAE